ncbi:MAG: asparaginase [Microscillaceae bacterium]|jgi:L-asparaginase|nr:asparaginase [Microscillaceae bacterium]
MKIVDIDTASPNPPQASVLIIYTGGTMGMVYDKRAKNLVPFDFSQILENVPELSQFQYRLTVLAFDTLIDSSNMQPAIWLKIAQVIYDKYAEYDGFVVLHGTDTMAYTASALSYMLENLRKPVIFTGAQLPIGAIRNDARRNLITSLEIAGAKTQGQAIVPEVCIFFNDILLRGNRSRKVESIHFDAFHSENYPELAKVGIQVYYNQAYILPQSIDNQLVLHPKMSNEVAILKLFPGINQATVHSILHIQGLKGLVLETYGSGNAPTADWFIEELRTALAQNIVILNVSQCIGGSVIQGRYSTSQKLLEIGVVGGADLTTEAAITKLMFLLAQDLTSESLKQQLKTPLRGEMTYA